MAASMQAPQKTALDERLERLTGIVEASVESSTARQRDPASAHRSILSLKPTWKFPEVFGRPGDDYKKFFKAGKRARDRLEAKEEEQLAMAAVQAEQRAFGRAVKAGKRRLALVPPMPPAGLKGAEGHPCGRRTGGAGLDRGH